MTRKPKGLAKLWREIKRPFVRRKPIIEKMKKLQAHRNEILSFFGASSEISRGVESALKYYHRWSGFLDIPRNECRLFAKHVGIDLQSEIRQTDELWVLDDIKLPLPQNLRLSGMIYG